MPQIISWYRKIRLNSFSQYNLDDAVDAVEQNNVGLIDMVTPFQTTTNHDS